MNLDQWRAAFQTEDFEDYFLDVYGFHFADNVPLRTECDEYGGYRYADPFAAEIFRAWKEHLQMTQWKEGRRQSRALRNDPNERVVLRLLQGGADTNGWK